FATNVNNATGSIDSTFTGLVTRFDMATNDDWYSLNVTSTISNLELVTNTPADGANQFVNTLNPHLELYNPSNTLVASGTNLADGRNEFIQYLPPVTGTYKVHVTGESSTSGEYFLSVKDASAPRITAVTVVPGTPLNSGTVLAPGSMSIQVTFSEPM